MSSCVHFSLRLKSLLNRSSVSSGKSSTRSSEMVSGLELRSNRAKPWMTKNMDMNTLLESYLSSQWSMLLMLVSVCVSVVELTKVLTRSWSSLVLIPSGTLCCQTSWNSDKLNFTAFCRSSWAVALHTLSSSSANITWPSNGNKKDKGSFQSLNVN